MNSIDKIFLINLDERIDRLEHFLNQCKIHNIPENKVERFSAINGKTHSFTKDDIKMFENASFNKTLLTPLIIKKKLMGNQLSHFNILLEMKKRDYDNIIIFQDDVILKDNFVNYIEKIMNDIPDNAEIINIGMHKIANCDIFEQYDINNDLVDTDILNDKITDFVYSYNVCNSTTRLRVNPASLAYIVTKKGCINLIQHFYSNGFIEATDWNYNFYLQNKNIFYGSKLILATGNNYFKSDIFINTDNYSLEDLIDTSIYYTDKNTTHSYFSTYNKLFEPNRKNAKNILEIGIGNFNNKNGGSLLLWNMYFKNAIIHGIDTISKEMVYDIVLNNNKIKTYLNTNAYDENVINKMKNKELLFDVIIDDGPHTLETQTKCIELYANLLSDNGILVIEDVQDISWIKNFIEITPIHLKKHIHIYDLRHVKNRYDDILFVINKNKLNNDYINNNPIAISYQNKIINNNLYIFTISKFRYPKHIEDTFNNYSFYYEDDYVYKQYFLENTNEFINYDTFGKIKNVFIKKLCFALYVLYNNGGFFIDVNVIPDENLNTFNIEDNFVYCVKSILNNDSLFLGIIGSSAKNNTLLQLINGIINLEDTVINISLNHIAHLFSNYENQIIYLNEKAVHSNCISTVTNNNVILFNHYYDPKICYTIPFEYKKIVNESDIKIGITLLLFEDINTFFSNGINQNSLFLGELLINCGFDVFFIVEDTKLFKIDESKLRKILYDSRFKYRKYSEILYSEFNVIITLSFSYGEPFIYNYLKHINTKHVGYFCGNTYIIESEKILYDQHKERQKDMYDFTINGNPKYDQIWSIPQMTDMNLDFWEILHKCKCIEVPFIWSNNAITLYCNSNNCKEEDLYYKNKGTEKKIAIFEPNISIMKWALPPILICEDAYRKNKLIKHLYVTNIGSSKTNNFNLPQFNKFMNCLDIVKDKKCSIESRYKTLEFMKNHADIAISHQWGNPLNYLYFDLAWMGWPIIHNAELCKDVGYYYENFSLKNGSSILLDVIKTHDLNMDTYLIHNRNIIGKFLPTNQENKNKYKQLIFSLFE